MCPLRGHREKFTEPGLEGKKEYSLSCKYQVLEFLFFGPSGLSFLCLLYKLCVSKKLR